MRQERPPLQMESPYGPVGDEEVVSRVVSNPHHIGKSSIKASVIPNSHISGSGLSVVRMGILPQGKFEEIARAISALIPKVENTPAGVILAKVLDIRSYRDSHERQALEVYDDPLPEEKDKMPENLAHALILQLHEYTEEDIVEIKTELMDSVFSKLVKLEDLRHPPELVPASA